jgi:hypothetical protein
VFCDLCGLHFLPKQSVCTRCRVSPTRYWFQLMSLVTMVVALSCNALVAWFLLPGLAHGQHPRWVFRAWLWFDQKAALYGWIPLAIALLAWDYLYWKNARPKVKGWITRKLLSLVLVAGIAPVLPWWVPAGQPPGEFLSLIGRHPGLPVFLAWAVLILVVSLLCTDAETRDYLLGHGRVLSLVSLSMLLLILTMTVVGWAMS